MLELNDFETIRGQQLKLPSEFQKSLIRKSNHIANRAKDIEENYLSSGTHIVSGLTEGEVLINKDFVRGIKRCAFAAYTDVLDLLK